MWFKYSPLKQNNKIHWWKLPVTLFLTEPWTKFNLFYWLISAAKSLQSYYTVFTRSDKWRRCRVCVTWLWRLYDVVVKTRWRSCRDCVTWLKRLYEVVVKTAWRCCKNYMTWLYRLCDAIVKTAWRDCIDCMTWLYRLRDMVVKTACHGRKESLERLTQSLEPRHAVFTTKSYSLYIHVK